MNNKNAIAMTTLSIIAIFAITSITISANEAFAVSITNYKMVEDTYAKVTFTFRDGVEETYFPVFKMTTSYVANSAAEFQLQGIVGDYPLLNEAMDQEYDFRLAPAETQYNYKKFIVDVDLIKGGVVQKNLHYVDCKVSGSTTDTVLDNAEGYTTTKTGFAIINVIDFDCMGVVQKTHTNEYDRNVYSQNNLVDYGKNSQKLAEDVHSYATFYFNDGAERIDFPVFKLNTGFDEKSKERPSFTVQGIVKPHKLLDNAIEKAKKVAGQPSLYNDDFQVNVDFTNDSKTFRTLKYSDCRVEEYKVDTLFDKEEGYTGKSGFAIVEDITVTCAGLTTKNYPSENIVHSNPYMMGGMTQAFATITLPHGEKETLNFPFFKQTSKTDTKVSQKISRLTPSFQLQGVVGDTPVLYKVVDLIRTRGPAGTDYQGLFSVAVDIVHNGKLVKTYNYDHCRVVSYDADTSFNAEEGYVGANGFALVGTYNFECNGYHPSNPSFEAMNVSEKAQNQSTNDLRNTDSWRVGFTVKQ